MDTQTIDSGLSGRMGVACRSPLDQWPSPPAAHAHNSSGNMLSSNTNGSFTGFSSSMSDNENSNSMMSDCQSSNSGTAPISHVKSTSGNTTTTSHPRQNLVSNIMLHGVAIVSLVIDNKERLCLAQISNTLLKDYSYNEIHNRRVALGITCVQCTPVQLEILRRAGAMPVSSRRCGMITKREAERLVKSFLEENTPPKLPDDFAFDVHHECGWGCRGFFEPSRYNSSRAKCIKCSFCNMYFSPNKFIFHFHRMPDAKYNHPDAANFNSWRRHLKLYSGVENDEIAYKWEDVKAMFNGGTRKRVFSSSSASSSSASSSLNASSISSMNHSSGHFSGRSHGNPDGGSGGKKAKTTAPMQSNPYLPKPPTFPNPFNPYNWLATGQGKAPYPFMAMNSSQSMCFGFPPQAAANKDAMAERMKVPPLAPTSWMGRSANPGPFSLSSMDLFWDKAFSFPQAAAIGFRNNGYPSPALPGAAAAHSAVTAAIIDNPGHLSPPSEVAPCHSPAHNVPQNIMKSSFQRGGDKIRDRMSAFKRVVPCSSSPSSSVSPPLNNHGDAESHVHNDLQRDDDANEDSDSMCAQDLSTHKDIEESEEIDVEEDADERKKKYTEECEIADTNDLVEKEENSDGENEGQHINQAQLSEVDDACDEKTDNGDLENDTDEMALSPHKPSVTGETSNGDLEVENSAEPCAQDSGLSDESDTEAENHRTFVEMTKEELCQTLKSEVESRRRREKEVNVLKETFREEVNREKSFREHMAQQLEMLRETLTSELEQERKIRFSLQQKLKEAHDALQNFSCGLLTGRRDAFSLKDTIVIPR
ncbi:unnamed protein product [Candidula unifasciata]|uniref:c-SKI SMAD4-binding domain-containing protein n=1 Tax=Candidula unifasciata TaxID=100452 RepID=A0A8S3ZHW3_9EUPU|nr:unnamed protein product [Candidula unifasciata]